MATRILIASANLASAQSTITFTNINQSFNDLEFWISARAGSGSTGGGSVGMYFNGNVGSGYQQRTAYGFGLGSGTQSGGGYMRIGSSVNPGDAAGYSTDWAILFNYSSSAINKVSFARTAQPNHGASAAAFHLDSNSVSFLDSPVTSITLVRDGGGTFAAGTRVSIYGIGR